MNLEELQIKIGIELKELNKQLKQASDDINKTLGPKATKKMMTDNNKVIKDGFKVMEKTAKDSAKQINRNLNNAFDINKTMVKFNRDIDRAMEQAKRSVRSACNDIRRELNAALNVNANIRVSASASMQRQGSYAKSDSAAIMASSQYTAAMMVKAINAMIDTDNKNAARLEGAIDKSTNKIVSELNKINTKNSQSFSRSKSEIETEVKTSIKVFEDGLQNEVDKLIQSITPSEIETSINVEADELQNEVNKLIQSITPPEIDTSINVKADGLQNEINKAIREVDVPNFKASIDVKADGLQNEVNKVIREVNVPNFKTSIDINSYNLQSKVNAAIKNIKVPTIKVGAELYYKYPDTTEGKMVGSPYGPDNKALIEAIKNAYKVINILSRNLGGLNLKQLGTGSYGSNGLQTGTVNFGLGKEGILDTSQIDALKQVHELKQKIKNTPLGLNAPDNSNPLLPDLTEVQKRFNAIKKMMEGVSLQEVLGKTSFDLTEFEILQEVMRELPTSVEKAKVVMYQLEKVVRSLGFESVEAFEKYQKLMNAGTSANKKPQRPEGFVPIKGIPGQLTKPQRPEGYNPIQGVEKTLSSEIIDVDAIKSVTSKAIKEFDDIRSELRSLDFKVIEESLIDIGDYVEPLKKQLEPVTKELLKVEAIDDEKISLNLDASDAKNQLRIIHEMYEDLIETCKTNNLNELKKALGVPEQAGSGQYPPAPPINKGTGSSNKGGKPPKPTIMGFGFGGFKNEIDTIIEYAKKAGEKIKKALFSKSKNGPDELALTMDDGDDSFKSAGNKKPETELPNLLEHVGIDFKEIFDKLEDDLSSIGLFPDIDIKAYFEIFDAALKKRVKERVEKALSPESIAAGVKADLADLADLEAIGFSPDIDVEEYYANFEDVLRYRLEKAKNVLDTLASEDINLKDIDFGNFDFGPYAEEVTRDLEKLGAEMTHNVDVYIEAFEALLEKRMKDVYTEKIAPFKEVYGQAVSDKGVVQTPIDFESFKEAYIKAAKEAAKIASQIPVEFKVVASGAENLKNIMNLPEFKDHAEALANIFKRIDFADELETNLDLDGLLAKLKGIQSIDDIDINLDDLRQDLIKFLEQLDKIRVEETDEIKIKVIDDEIVKATKLLKELDDARSRLRNSGGGGGGNGPRGRLPGSGNFTTGRRPPRPGSFMNSGRLPGSGAFTLFASPGPMKLHKILTQLEQKVIKVFNKIKKVAASVAMPIITPFKNAFNRVMTIVKNVASKISSTFKSAMTKVSTTVKNYGAVIKYHLNKAFDGIKSTKLYSKVASGLNKAKGAVSKFASATRTILGKAFDGIKIGAKVAKGIASGLNKAKGVLSKFANSCKTLWGKIKQIFSKGANDASKATGKLTSGLKALLAQALGFFSLYGLINLGKQAIQQSGMLAQSEVKLTALMKQRMGATNETVRAIRELAKEQANLGVVSEAAMVRGAEQLSMYVHSAKALQTLMPAIANMTARRGGFNATEDDAMEIATQLGEAIREGTTTPLEQSGIYLSEAEIKKFQALRTEEERAAYLADVIAKNVGNINEALANTPHGQIAQLKNNFKSLLGTLGTLLVNVIQPIVKWLNVIVVAANNALKALGELLGFDMTGGGLSGVDLGTGSTGGTPTDTSGIDSATDSLDGAKDSAEEAEKAVEKFKGSLMGFDEINILSDNTNKNSGSEEDDPTNITPGEGGQLDPGEYIPTEMTEGENIFSKFGEKIKAFMDEIIEPFKNAWDLLGERWKAEWADLIESFKHFCDSLAKFLKSVWDNGGKEFVQHMAEIGLACGIAAMEIGGEILDSLARLWEHLDPAHNKHTQGFLDALNETSVKLRDFILGLGDHFESLMANGGQDVLNAMGDCFMDLGNAAVTGLGLAIDALDGLIDHLDPANNEITRNMLKSWEDAFHAIGQCALDFVDFLDSVLKNGGQDVINALGDAFVSLVGLVGDVVKEVSEAFSGLFKHLDPATNQFTKDFLKAWEDAFNSIADMFGSLGDLLGSAMDNGGQELLNSVGDLGMKLGEAFGVIVDEVAKTLSELFTHMDPATNPHSKKMLDSLDGLVDSITKFVDACIDAFKRFMDNGGREFVTNLGDILAIVIDLAAELGSGIIDVITAFINSWAGQTLIEGVAQALAWVSEKLVGLADSFDIVKDMFHNIVDMIIAVFEGDGEKLGQAFAKLIKNTFKLTGELVVWLGEVAADLIKGLVEGICALPGLLWEAVKFIFDAIVGFFKELFGIHSPSTVFADLGKNLIEGLVKGVTDCVNLVTGAFKKVCDAITNTIKDISKAVSDKFKEIKDGISEKLKETKEVVSEKWSEIKTTVSEKAKETYDAARDNWANLKQTVSERARETYETVKGNWENLKQNTADRFKETYDIAQERFTNIREAIKEKATKTFEDVSNSWTKIKEDAGKKLEEIKTDAEKRYEDVKNTLVNKIEEAKKGIVEKWEEVRNKTNECIENVRQTSEEKYNEIKETIVNRLEDIKSSTEKKWEEIKKNTGTAVENIKKEAEEQYGKIKDSLLDTLEKTKSAMATKWENIKTDAINKVSEIVKQATTKFGEIKKNFGDKLDEVKSSLTSKWKSLSTQAFDGAKNIVSQVKSGLSSIGSTISDAITGSKSKVTSALNEIGRVISGVKWKFPEINLPKIPEIDVTWKSTDGSKWFPSIKYPSFSWNARGGIIDGITPLGFANGAMQMGGEAGSELVVPLENTSFTSKIAKALGQAVDNTLTKNYNNNNNNSNPFANNNGDIILQVDGREFARCSINQINKLQRESGRTLLDV